MKLAATLAIGLALMGWRWYATAQDLEQAQELAQARKSAVEEAQAAIKELKQENRRAQEALVAAREARREEKERVNRLLQDITRLEKTNDEVRVWAGRSLPGPILDRLRREGGSDPDEGPSGGGSG